MQMTRLMTPCVKAMPANIAIRGRARSILRKAATSLKKAQQPEAVWKIPARVPRAEVRLSRSIMPKEFFTTLFRQPLHS